MNLHRVRKTGSNTGPGGLAWWLLGKLRGARSAEPRLTLVERISIAPRQTLALVEVEGQRFLVASSAEGASSFYPLQGNRLTKPCKARARSSW